MKKRTLLKVIVLGDSGYVLFLSLFPICLFTLFYKKKNLSLFGLNSLEQYIKNFLFLLCNYYERCFVLFVWFFRVGKTSLMNQYPLYGKKFCLFRFGEVSSGWILRLFILKFFFYFSPSAFWSYYFMFINCLIVFL